MPLEIVRHDITKMKVDVIVNAANTALKMGGGVCGAIFKAAGADQLQAECDQIGQCDTGEAVITSGYELPARYIIHTAGPIWRGGSHNEARLLHSCYINSLNLALQYKCKSIAFPLISSGIYGYPKDQALQIAMAAIAEFLLDHEMKVYLVVFDKQAITLSGKLFADIEQYIDDHYVDELQQKFSTRRTLTRHDMIHADICESYHPVTAEPSSLEDILQHLDESFSERLLRLIDQKGLTDVETYKRANIDRKLFSKIRSDKHYHPRKATALAFAIALQLDLDETLDLLGTAGYTLSMSNKFDLIIRYCLESGLYDIHKINQILFEYDQMLLGA